MPSDSAAAAVLAVGAAVLLEVDVLVGAELLGERGGAVPVRGRERLPARVVAVRRDARLRGRVGRGR